LLLERGITLRKGRCHVDAALGILENADAKLSGALRMLLAQLKLEFDHLDMRIDEADAVIKKTAHENEACRRLVAIPGIGPVTATAVIAAIGNGGGLSQGSRVRSLDGSSSARTLHRRQTEAARHQQTWELLLAKTFRARCTRGPATAYEAVSWSEQMVGPTHLTYPSECGRSSPGEQAGAHGVGRAREE
jgi:transposase